MMLWLTARFPDRVMGTIIEHGRNRITVLTSKLAIYVISFAQPSTRRYVTAQSLQLTQPDHAQPAWP